MKQDPLLAPGARIGGLVVEEILAFGSASQVFRAREEGAGGRRVALKVFAAGELDASERARFEREATILRGIHHPHLMEVLHHGEDARHGVLYLASRMVEGPTLEQVLAARKGLGPCDAAARWRLVSRLAEIADALALLHQRGLVHRDVKPANVALRRADATASIAESAVLLDFGLTRRIDGLSSTEGHLTLPYAAPELLRTQVVDPRLDVFGLGVTAHDLLAARDPSTRRARQLFGLEPLHELVPDIEPDLATILAKACDPEPERRYVDGGELRDDWRRWLAGKRIAVNAARRGNSRTRSRAGKWTAAAVVVGVVLAAAWSRWGPKLDRETVESVDASARNATRILATRHDLRRRVGLHAIATADEAREIERTLAARLAELAPGDLRLDLLRQLARRLAEPRDRAEPPWLDPALPRWLEPNLSTAGEAEALHIAAALGSCGEEAALRRILEWWSVRAADSGNLVEESRLSIVAIARVVTRARAWQEAWFAGFVPYLAELVDEVRPLVARAQARIAASDPMLRNPVAELLCAIAFGRRGHAVAPGWTDGFALTERELARIAAAQGEADSAEREMARVSALARTTEGVQYEDFERMGWIAGAIGDEGAHDQLLAAVEDAARGASRSLPWSLSLFERGRDCAQRQVAGELSRAPNGLHNTVAGFVPDFPSRRTVVPCQVAPPIESRPVIEWWFTGAEVQARGLAGRIELVDSDFEEVDSHEPAAPRHLLLPIPGRSAVELRYVVRGGTTRVAQLYLSAQKDACTPLPFTGESSLVVQHDGRPVTTLTLDAGGVGSVRECVLPRIGDAAEHEHVLRLEVPADSTVGVRLFNAWIVLVEG